MKQEQWKKIWLAEEQRAFQGWDFSCLQSRWQREPLGWDYKAIVQKHLRPADRLLDMGTGGGEFLLSIGHPYGHTAVTEAWPPNIQLCLERLAPLGIKVYPMRKADPLPMADDSFDLVINRHEQYDLCEVRRVLKPGGMFITQQVGGENCATLAKRLHFETPAQTPFSLETELPEFRACGFSVQAAREQFPELKFFDAGAIVFWAKMIVWSFPGFRVERNFTELCALQNEIEKNGFVSTLEHRFLLAAQNMK